MAATHVLEPEAQTLVADTKNPPFIFQLGPEKGNKLFDEIQSAPVDKVDVDIEDADVPGGPTGTVPVRIMRPKGATGPLPALLYIHGGGWVFCNTHTHDRLIRELTAGAGVALVFPSYALSPAAKYPTAIEQNYAVLEWIAKSAAPQRFDSSRIAVMGDSVGGNMAAAAAIMAKQRGGPKLACQLLAYPVTDANFDTASYKEFAIDHLLRRDGMQWFWDQYTTDPKQRAEITASPLRATVEQLKGLPPALVITAEVDVLRDEGEAYANQLRSAGVPVRAARFQGTVHDFIVVNALSPSQATRGAIQLAIAYLLEKLA